MWVAISGASWPREAVSAERTQIGESTCHFRNDRIWQNEPNGPGRLPSGLSRFFLTPSGTPDVTVLAAKANTSDFCIIKCDHAITPRGRGGSGCGVGGRA